MKYQNLFFVYATGLCLFAGAAFAQSADLQAILGQQHALAKELQSGSVDLTPRAKNIVLKAQAEVFQLSEGKVSLADFNIAEKTKLENALERINAAVVGTRRASAEKQICKRVALTGSSMKTTRCASAAEWEQLREVSRRALEKQQVCVPPGCGS